MRSFGSALSSAQTGFPAILPARSQSARSTPLIASNMKPPLWPRTRIVAYIRSQSAEIRSVVPSNSSRSSAGHSRWVMMLHATSGASGACASPQPTRPLANSTRTSAVSKFSE